MWGKWLQFSEGNGRRGADVQRVGYRRQHKLEMSGATDGRAVT